MAEIGILVYPGGLKSAIHGLTELFYVGNRMAENHEGQKPVMRVSHWQQAPDSQEVKCVFDTHPDQPNRPNVIIVPPNVDDPMSSELAMPMANWLKEHHKKGAVLSSVCAGAFLLAETGLLDKRPATTHWVYADTLTKNFPAIDVCSDKLVVDDGDIITTGGMMAWTDLGLRLLHRLLGPTIMIETARYMLVDPPGREQRYYSSFIPQLHHGDDQILKVQHWLQANGARNVTVKDMAEQAGMGERNFIRRFQQATTLNPTEYCQHLRVGKAREMLEFSKQNVTQISWAVGYEDAGAFRKVFQKIVGLSPGEYRQRFSVEQVAA